LQAYAAADWLRKNISGGTIISYITTQSHSCKGEVVRGVRGHPPRKCGFLRPTFAHFKVFEGHNNGTIALKACQWAVP